MSKEQGPQNFQIIRIKPSFKTSSLGQSGTCLFSVEIFLFCPVCYVVLTFFFNLRRKEKHFLALVDKGLSMRILEK